MRRKMETGKEEEGVENRIAKEEVGTLNFQPTY